MKTCLRLTLFLCLITTTLTAVATDTVRINNPCLAAGNAFTITVPARLPVGMSVEYEWYRNDTTIAGTKDTLTTAETVGAVYSLINIEYTVPDSLAYGDNVVFYFKYSVYEDGVDEACEWSVSTKYLLTFRRDPCDVRDGEIGAVDCNLNAGAVVMDTCDLTPGVLGFIICDLNAGSVNMEQCLLVVGGIGFDTCSLAGGGIVVQQCLLSSGVVGVSQCLLTSGMVGIQRCDLVGGMVGLSQCLLTGGAVGLEQCLINSGAVGVTTCSLNAGAIGVNN